MTADGFEPIGPVRPLCSLFGPGDPTFDPRCGAVSSEPDSLEAEFGAGSAVNIALGTWIGRRWRSELDLGYHQQSLDSIDTGAVSSGDVAGDMSVAKVAWNFWYAFSEYPRIQPYIGAGAGLVRVDWRDVTIDGQAFTDDRDEGLLLQLGAGLELPLTERLRASLDYRLQWADDLSFDYIPFGDDAFDLELGAHLVTVGLSYRFGGAADGYLDDDGDRIPDYRDACVGSHWGEWVDARGCSSESSDREPVVSSRACAVSEDGRSAPEACRQLLLRDGVVVWFVDSDEELSAAVVPMLAGVVDAYKRHPALRFWLFAVEPLRAGVAVNNAGASRRVAQVRELLVAQGVPVSALRSGDEVVRAERFDAKGVLVRAVDEGE